MPIKQLQLRGITRVPSDRGSADGGCAESLNVHLDQQETAPTIPEKDISSTIYGENAAHPIVFIHKMTGAKNYISFDVTGDSSTRKIWIHAYGSRLTGGFALLKESEAGNTESLQHVASIGNTLVVYTDAKPYFFLFKDNAYTFLGNEIPRPGVEVLSVPLSDPTNNWATATVEGGLGGTATISAWNDAVAPGATNHDSLLSTMENVWEKAEMLLSKYRNNGVYAAPFFLRYALRLYDGSYIYSSTPILCGGSKEEWVTAYLYHDASVEPQLRPVIVTMNNLFQVYVKGSYEVGSWSDIVKSIDFFVSTPIFTPAIEAGFAKMKSDYYIVFDGMDDETREQTIKDAVLSKGQFFKVKSVDINNSKEKSSLAGGLMQIYSSDDVSGEKLATHEELTDGYRDGVQYSPMAETRNYNNRLMLAGVKETLAYGDMYLNGQVCYGSTGTTPPTNYRYKLRYKIVDPSTGDSHYVVSQYYDGSTIMYSAYKASRLLMHGDETATGSNIQYTASRPYSWICYPDTRCKEVELSYYGTSGQTPLTTIRIPMEQHPYLECAYAFFGLGVTLRDEAVTSYPTVTNPSFTEDRIIESDNKLIISEFENPFLFTAANIMTFPDKLVGTAAVTVPLSEGQVGDFNLYVFTEGGIKVLVPAHDGTFAAMMTPPSVSRHVALPGTILSMEQAVVFITNKGVMMLSGNNVTELSQFMHGKPFVINGPTGSDLLAIKTLLMANGSPVQSIFNPAMDTTLFMTFMANAKIAYDSKGARFIFFNKTLQYQYVYMLETQTWHKYYDQIANPYILNSYPDCLVSQKGAAPKVYDFSARLAEEVTGSFPGLIVTRPFDLGEPDIRKAIRSIRIRGNYNRKDAQYLLLGSFDGINWKWMKSLRGGSYKQFRLIILANLAATERITWIDVDYETRMTNRLR